MSVSHQVIVSQKYDYPNLLRCVQTIRDHFSKQDNIVIKEITLSKSLDCFNIYFTYDNEQRRLFICELMDMYYDMEYNPIPKNGMYFSINVWGESQKIMELVKEAVYNVITSSDTVYERPNDAYESRFTLVK